MKNKTKHNSNNSNLSNLTSFTENRSNRAKNYENTNDALFNPINEFILSKKVNKKTENPIRKKNYLIYFS